MKESRPGTVSNILSWSIAYKIAFDADSHENISTIYNNCANEERNHPM